VVAHTLDRLGRNIRECLNLIHELREREIGVRTLADPIPINTLDTSGTGEIAVLMLALFAQMERIFTCERAAHARSVAAVTGRQPGRPRKLTDAQVRRATAALDAGASLAEVAADYNVDRSTLYRRVQAHCTERRILEQDLRCCECGTRITAPEVACPNCNCDDPTPTARDALAEASAEPPAEPDGRYGPAQVCRQAIGPGSIAEGCSSD
jgi:rRNA maturation endonuclease Nob1